MHGYYELVIKQMMGEYHTRHPRMRSYQNVAHDLTGGFEECNFNLIPRLQNYVANYMATSASSLKVPIQPSGRYEIELRNRPYVPNNVKR